MQLRFAFLMGLSFELLGRAVAQGGMQALLIVVSLDELLDVIMQVLQILVLVGVDFLPLQSFEKAFATGVVVRIRRPAHTRNHPVLLENRDVFGRDRKSTRLNS